MTPEQYRIALIERDILTAEIEHALRHDRSKVKPLREAQRTVTRDLMKAELSGVRVQ